MAPRAHRRRPPPHRFRVLGAFCSSPPVPGPSQAVDTPYPDSPWVVLKFGGRSVSTADNWAIIARLVRGGVHGGVRPVVGPSAPGCRPNPLVALPDTGCGGGGTDEKLGTIRAQHDT